MVFSNNNVHARKVVQMRSVKGETRGTDPHRVIDNKPRGKNRDQSLDGEGGGKTPGGK